MTRLENVTKTAGFACGSLGPVAISIWDGAAMASHARSAASMLASLARTEKNVVLLAILGPNVTPPEGEIRDILSQQLARMEDRIGGVAQVVEGQGFRAATLRAVLTGMALMLRMKRVDKVYDSAEEGAAFLAGINGRVHASEIIRAVAELRIRDR